MDSINELKLALDKARKREEQNIRDVSNGRLDFQSQEYIDAEMAVLDLERQLAAVKDEPYAVPCDFPIKWDVGAPLPHLFASDNKTFLTFYVDIPDPNWDGTYCTVKDPGDGKCESLAIVEFKRCHAVKLGDPNDEVHHGHSLHGQGQVGYTAQIVKNSPWIEELRLVNSVHSCYDARSWEALDHYVFWFHDSTFECVAESYEVKLYQSSMCDLAAEVVTKLLN